MGRAPVRDALLLVCRPRAARAIGARASLIVRGAKWSLDSPGSERSFTPFSGPVSPPRNMKMVHVVGCFETVPRD